MLLHGTTRWDSTSVTWTVDCWSEFDKLKQTLLSAPILAGKFKDYVWILTQQLIVPPNYTRVL